MANQCEESMQLHTGFNELAGQSVSSVPLHWHSGPNIGKLDLPQTIEETNLDHVTYAIASVWTALHLSTTTWRHCSLGINQGDRLPKSERAMRTFGDSNHLLVPFGYIPNSKPSRNTSHPIMLAIATRDFHGAKIHFKISNSYLKQRQEKNIILAAKRAIGSCHWQTNNSFAPANFASVIKRPHHLSTCAIDTILNAWAYMLSLEPTPAASKTQQFSLDFYDTAFDLVKLALQGRLLLGAIMSFLAESGYCRQRSCTSRCGEMDKIQAYAMNGCVLQLVGKDLDRAKRVTIECTLRRDGVLPRSYAETLLYRDEEVEEEEEEEEARANFGIELLFVQNDVGKKRKRILDEEEKDGTYNPREGRKKKARRVKVKKESPIEFGDEAVELVCAGTESGIDDVMDSKGTLGIIKPDECKITGFEMVLSRVLGLFAGWH